MKENPNDRIANDSDDGFQLLRQTLFRDKITFGPYEIKKKIERPISHSSITILYIDFNIIPFM